MFVRNASERIITYGNIEQESDIEVLQPVVVFWDGADAGKVCKLVIKYKKTPAKNLTIIHDNWKNTRNLY